MHSHTEENYLKAIYKLLEKQHAPISTNSIADKMKTKAASVTDMLQKLSQKKLVEYEKYHGVTLSKKGEKVALSIIRKHRLWEMFLVEKLAFGWDEVHDVAEQLEHIHSEKLIAEIDRFLNYPKFDPHGDPIPDVNGRFSLNKSVGLNTFQKGQRGKLTGVIDHAPIFLRYLEELGIRLGVSLFVEQVTPFDRSMQIKIGNKKAIFISEQVAKNILVSNETK